MPVMAHLLMSVFKMTSCPEFIGKANGMVVMAHGPLPALKVHKIENFFGFDFEFCPISLLVMHK
jgi:hypothetical protein